MIGSCDQRDAGDGCEDVAACEIVHGLSRIARAGAARCWVETRTKVATMRAAALMLPETGRSVPALLLVSAGYLVLTGWYWVAASRVAGRAHHQRHPVAV